MNRFSPELKVGLFAVAVIVILAFMTFRVGGMRLTKKPGYTLYAYFNNSVGIDNKTRVKVAGVNAGEVENIELIKGRARISMRMNSEILIRSDAQASIRALGLLGDKYVALSQGSDTARYLKDGDTIENTYAPTDYETLVSNLSSMSSKFAEVADSLNRFMGDPENQQGITNSIEKINMLTENLNRAVVANDRRIAALLEQISELVDTTRGILDENRESLARTISGAPGLIEEMEAASRDLRNLISEIRGPVLASVRNIEETTKKASETFDDMSRVAERIDKGEGTLGKLVTDDALYESVTKAAEQVGKQLERLDRFRVFVEFKGEYLDGISDAKGDFNLRWQPRPDKYYQLGIVTDPLGNTSTREIIRIENGVETVSTETTTERDIEFTALIARRFGNTFIRGGLMENTFGVGAQYLLWDDRVTLSADIWDFGRDEFEADSPHLKLGLDYQLFKYIVFTAGYDNVLNGARRGFFVGGGMRFEDEDLKYLFGAMPAVPVN